MVDSAVRRLTVRLVAVVGLAVLMAACSRADNGGPVDEPVASSATTVTSGPAQEPTTEETDPTRGSSAGDEAADLCRPVGEASPQAGQGSTQEIQVETAGNTYPVRLFIPAGQGEHTTADGRHPVVLNWHGLGSDGFQQALLTNYEALAEDEGFIVVHPTGSGGGVGMAAGGMPTGWELQQFDVPERDDVAMVEMLIDRLVADHCADPSRIYSTGMSNGGFFTSRLVCELADRIAAAVTVAGISHPDDCRPARPVPLMAFHGTADAIVPFDGGPSQLQGDDAPAVVVDFFDQVMPEELAEFAADFGCRPDPDRVAISSEVTAFDHPGCTDDVPVRFVEIDGGGHTWPGALFGVVMAESLGHTTTDVSATADGWRFMSRFTLPG